MRASVDLVVMVTFGRSMYAAAELRAQEVCVRSTEDIANHLDLH
jgi:hypothetical protein